MKSDTYLANLQAFAAGGTLPNREGRYFNEKLRQLHSSLRQQIAHLTEDGASVVMDAIRGTEGRSKTSSCLPLTLSSTF